MLYVYIYMMSEVSQNVCYDGREKNKSLKQLMTKHDDMTEHDNDDD